MFDDEAARAAHLYRLRERVIDVLTRPIAAAVEQGTLRPLPPHAVAHLLIGNIHGYLMAVTCAPEGVAAPVAPSAQQGAAFITEILFDGLLTDRARS
jgi:hypothetical protein